jgi:hypothetical protein
MKKTSIAPVTLLMSLLILTLSIQLVEANPVGLFQGLPSITIQSDGSVTPKTQYIKQQGNIYYLTENLTQNYKLVINCSNTVFDGQGHIINGSKRFLWGDRWIDSQCKGITLENVKNVTIKNVIINGFYEPSIYIAHCSNINILNVQTDAKPTLVVDIDGCIWIEESTSNTISKCITGLRLESGSNNRVFGNTIYLSIQASNNFFYKNNINVHYASNGFQFPIIGDGSINSWDNGAIGNYWSDFKGSDSYVIDENNIDHYPLTQSVDIPVITPTLTDTINELIPQSTIIVIVAVPFLAIILATLSKKQRKGTNLKK